MFPSSRRRAVSRTMCIACTMAMRYPWLVPFKRCMASSADTAGTAGTAVGRTRSSLAWGLQATEWGEAAWVTDLAPGVWVEAGLVETVPEAVMGQGLTARGHTAPELMAPAPMEGMEVDTAITEEAPQRHSETRSVLPVPSRPGGRLHRCRATLPERTSES